MARHDFRMPDIGEGIVDAEVIAWHVAVGERIEEDAPLADVMTDKATVEITSPVSGTVVALGCAAGERITIGESLARFETGEAASVAGVAADTGAPTGRVVATDATRIDEPDRSVPRDERGTRAADALDRGGHDVATPSPLPKPPKRDGTSAARSTSGASAGPRLNAPRREDKPHIRLLPEPTGGTRKAKALAAPAVRRRARELGIELSQVFGSGPAGRVLAADLEAGARARRAAVSDPATASLRTGQATDNAASTATTTARDTSDREGTARGPVSAGASRHPLDEDIPLIGLRRVIAERLAESSREIPHFTYVEEVDVTELETLRQHLNARRDPSLPRLSLLHFVLVGVCRAVRGWPQCNAHHDDAQGTLRCHSAVHLGVATMTDEGLLVPVVPDADALGLDAMAAAVAELAAAARAKRLPRERLTGSTITVTSLGTLAGIATTPIINRPETAIVGPNRMTSKLVRQDGRIVERRVMNVSSSFDHRIVDGHDAASFIAELRSLLEHPATLFI